MVLVNPSNLGAIQSGNIAYISCDAIAYTGPLDATNITNLAIARSPGAIVLFSTVASRCTFTPTDGFTNNVIYTMPDANTSMILEKALKVNSPPDASTTIRLAQQQNNGSGDVGKSPSTAVAMIILYSITGIITALFLIIIVIGALRAHRHPERYGPRHVMGRARQSRARGIARAMLETLPIVKFGEWETQKQAPGTAAPQPRSAQPDLDVELGTTENANHPTPPTTADHATTHPTQPATTTESTPPTSPTATPAVVITETHFPPVNAESSETTNADNGLACSVCTDDFIKGQDIRVLPCKHKFHPECIDPWLLNVSGTCPLCRVDLRPTKTHDFTNEDGPGEEGPHEVATEPSAHVPPNNRRSRTGLSSLLSHQLNIHRMRDATPQERIAALREVRTQQRGTQEPAQTDGSSDRPLARNRMSARLSRAFHRNGHDSRPHSTAEPLNLADGSGGGSTPTPTPTTREREDRAMNEM